MRSVVRLLAATVALLALLGSATAQAASPTSDRGEECTIGVACGRATADGRPLLWKNRDAHQRDNVIAALADGKVPYFALCDAGNTTLVWGGANAAGFAIVNAVARDFPEVSAKGPVNGAFMKLALQQCTTVAELEALLKETDTSGRRTRANFAVIDARGGAAMFEVGHTTWKKFDATASDTGIVVRTNFATTTGQGERGMDRYLRADELCRSPQAKLMTPRFLLQQVLRDLRAPQSAQRGEKGRLDTRETLHRQTTVAALVVQGVQEDESPAWTTMYAVLGQPLFSMAVPLFPSCGAVPLALAGDPKSAICDASQRLAAPFYVPAGTAEIAPHSPAEPAAGTPPTEPAKPAEPSQPAPPAEAEASGPLLWLRTDTVPLTRRSVLFGEADVLARHEEALGVWRKAGPNPPPASQRAYQEAMAKLVLQQLRELAEAQTAPTGAGK